MKQTQKQNSEGNLVFPSFDSYLAAVRKYSNLADRMQAELVSLYRIGCSPVGAAVHLHFIFNR